MAELNGLRVEPTAATSPGQPVAGVGPEQPAALPPAPAKPASGLPPAATTSGQMRAAYAQFVIHPDTHDVIVRIRDAMTDEVLNEIPAPQVEEMSKFLRDYADALARRRVATQSNQLA